MVSKPTGRPRGRPRKIAPTASQNRRRGRPPKSLSNDPDRYWLAFVQAHIPLAKADGLSEVDTIRAFIAPRIGLFEPSEDNLVVLNAGGTIPLFAPWTKGREGGSEWRDQNSFNPHIDDVRRKLRTIRSSQSNDAHWLAAMAIAWFECLQGRSNRVGYARALATSKGELTYFENVMYPLMLRRAIERHSGAERSKFSLPEYLSLFFPAT